MTPRQLRDVLGLLSLFVGVGGLLTVVYIANPLAGFGLAAFLLAVLGAWLITDR